MKTPEFRNFLGENRVPTLINNGQALIDAARSRILGQKGEANSSCAVTALALCTTAAILGIVLMQAVYDNRQNKEVAGLRATVAALTTPAALQTPEVKLVVESPTIVSYLYRGKEVSISISDDFRPSRGYSWSFNYGRQPEELLDWKDISEIKNIPVAGKKLITVRNPLITWEFIENPGSGNALSDFFRSYGDKHTNFELLVLRAIVRNKLGEFEERNIYIPLNTPGAQDFVDGYTPGGPFIPIEERNGRYFHYPGAPWKENLGEIPSDQINTVTLQ